MQKKNNRRVSFRYTPSFLIIIGFIIVGFALEIANSGAGFPTPLSPFNIYFIIFYILTLTILYFIKPLKHLINWFSSMTMAVSTISVFMILVAIAGFVPQGGLETNTLLKKIGFSHLITSWTYVFSLLFVTTSLFFVIMKKLIPFRIKNIPFLLNHIGLFIILFFGSLSVGHLEKYNVELFIDSAVQEGFMFDKLRPNETPEFPDQKLIKRTVSLPFMLKMSRFEIDNYPSEILYYDSLGVPIKTKSEKEAGFIVKDKKFLFRDWEIIVEKYIESATPRGDDYLPYEMDCDHPAFLSAAYLKAENIKTDKKIEGWVTCGNRRKQSAEMSRLLMRIKYFYSPTYLELGDYSISIGQPGRKRFASYVTMMTPKGELIEKIIEVNKPFKYKDWYLYQTDCRYKLIHPESSDPIRSSTLQAVKDPWLHTVYVGFFMLLAGSLTMIFSVGKFSKENKK